jgi:hypothetical protein
VRNLLVWVNERRYGGVVPGIYRILARDLNILIPTGWLYNYLHMRKSSPLSRLQRETLATTWPRYDLDLKTWALLSYAKKLTQQPSMVEDSDIEDLRAAPSWAMVATTDQMIPPMPSASWPSEPVPTLLLRSRPRTRSRSPSRPPSRT